jgi:hypothetical protein
MLNPCLRSLLLILLAAPVVIAQRSVPGAAPAAPKAEEKAWDIAAPFGPTSPLVFDTAEGTWMNVDVSPDGVRIVFDLLGDLYTMSIDGSGRTPATRLTHGSAFDMQPRFSPDGNRLPSPAIAAASSTSG